jgi:NADH-quinone oxidoreductase subunit J
MTFPDILGYILGAGALASSIAVVVRRDAVVAAMNLVLAFFCLSGIYLLIGFPFLAALQVLVYAGAIMVLFLFVIMLLGVTSMSRVPLGARSGLGALVAVAVAVEGSILGIQIAGQVAPPDGGGSETVAGVSALLFHDRFVIPFELTGVVLLASMIAVVVLARRDSRVKSMADFAKTHSFDPRPLVGHRPDPDAPDGIAARSLVAPEGNPDNAGAGLAEAAR